ncbi:uncharacterized protein DUF4174 [Larkinella arboricola]|uniref:Uncharacterized protein DUF4174 n=2 Tax=Larkinella arboricola TaxID=643671 RepID=A0A327X818_LARAB|nr:uncharacterized protein DUF4174 [Larkinella arboricola]
MRTGWLMGILMSITLFGAMESNGTLKKSLKALLAEKQDHRRVLVLYGREDAQHLLIEQQEALHAERDQLAERDLDVIVLLSYDLPEPDRQFLMQEPFGLIPSENFQGWLIGKDGGVKHTFKKPIETGELFGLIDSMPMRKEEAKKQ